MYRAHVRRVLRHDHAERDTVIGAGIGAAAGAAITGDVGGALIGGAVGGVIGNQVGKHDTDRGESPSRSTRSADSRSDARASVTDARAFACSRSAKAEDGRRHWYTSLPGVPR